MRILATLILLAFCQISFAQWSTDPNNPKILCNAAEQQRLPQVLEDGNNGWFIFWKDLRGDGELTEIYGQHIDNGGNELWTANGKLILSHANLSVVEFDVKRMSDGTLLFFYGINDIAISNTMLAMKIDENGEPLWNSPSLVGEPESNIQAFHDPLIQPSNTGAILAFRSQIVGGQLQTRFNRIESDGAILYGINGHQLLTTAHGPIDIMSDGNEGAIVHWRNSNGGGTHMGVMRLNSSSDEMWGNIVDPVEATNGLYWDYRAISDNAGGIIISYVETGAQIKILRLDGNGNQVWTSNNMPVGTFGSLQDRPRLILHENAIYVTWQDNRPPANNQDQYIQKLDINGNIQWSAEGEIAVQGLTYIPWNAITKASDSGVIITQLMSANGFVGQKIDEDGNAVWTETTQIAVPSLVPFYGEYELVSDPLGGAVCVWYNADSQDLYISKLSPNGDLGVATGIKEFTSDKKVIIYPNPARDFITIKHDNGIQSIRVFNIYGELVIRSGVQSQLDISSLSSGVYTVCIESQNDMILTEKLTVK